MLLSLLRSIFHIPDPHQESTLNHSSPSVQDTLTVPSSIGQGFPSGAASSHSACVP